jgi:hypothetical protein
MVARHADVWHALFPSRPAELESAVTALKQWCDREGATRRRSSGRDAA